MSKSPNPQPEPLKPMFDHESTIQDADIETRELMSAARREARLRRLGRCPHSWLQCPPGPPNKPTSVVTCNHCGATWATEAEAYEARRLILD